MTVTEVLVEVDVATARPPRVHDRIYTWLTVREQDRVNVQVEAEHVAMLMAMCHPHVVMPLGARVIEWKETAENNLPVPLVITAPQTTPVGRWLGEMHIEVPPDRAEEYAEAFRLLGGSARNTP